MGSQNKEKSEEYIPKITFIISFSDVMSFDK